MLCPRMMALSNMDTDFSHSSLPSSPAKRARDDNEAGGSGTEPQKKRQKEDKNSEQQSLPSHIHRLNTMLRYLISYSVLMFTKSNFSSIILP